MMHPMKLDYCSILEKLRHVLYPQRCIGCDAITGNLSAHQYLCKNCLPVWKHAIMAACPDCGQSNITCRCRPSAWINRPQTACYHLASYHEPMVQKLLFQIKSRKDADINSFIGGQTALLCEQAIRDADNFTRDQWIITYAPRTPEKYLDTGIDQAAALSRSAAQKTGLPFVKVFMHRRHQSAQKELSSAQRAENAYSGYRLMPHMPNIAGKSVLLFDDIITTGSTMAACIDLLFSAGVMYVACITVAKTYRQQSE